MTNEDSFREDFSYLHNDIWVEDCIKKYGGIKSRSVELFSTSHSRYSPSSYDSEYATPDEPSYYTEHYSDYSYSIFKDEEVVYIFNGLDEYSEPFSLVVNPFKKFRQLQKDYRDVVKKMKGQKTGKANTDLSLYEVKNGLIKLGWDEEIIQKYFNTVKIH